MMAARDCLSPGERAATAPGAVHGVSQSNARKSNRSRKWEVTTVTPRPMLTAPLAVLLFLPASEARNRDPGDLGNLAQVTSGQRIEVIDMNLKRTRGEFLASSPEELRVKASSGAVAIPRAQVFRVSLLEKSKRLRNALIGMAVGAAAGLATGAAVDSSFSEDDEHVAKMLFVPIGIGAGAGLGAAFPGFETIYRAPKRTTPAPAGGAGVRAAGFLAERRLEPVLSQRVPGMWSH